MRQTYQNFTIALLICLSLVSYGQKHEEREIENQTLFGLNISPVFPGNFIRKSDISFSSDTVNYSINLKNSISLGAEIRHYFTYRFALVTGILFTKRYMEAGYRSHYPTPSTKHIDTAFVRDLEFITYEIPIHALGYVRLTKHLYMSISGGLNLNFYPSHIKVDNVYVQRVGTKIGRYAWQFFQLGYTANVGWEFRAKDIGTFYLGASYQARMDKMARVGFYEKTAIHRADYDEDIRGDYFSVNFKYFFPLQEKKSKKDLFR